MRTAEKLQTGLNVVSGRGEQGSLRKGRSPIFIRSRWKVFVIAVGATVFLVCGLVLILSFVSPRIVGADAKYFFGPDGGLFAEVSYPLDALERSFLKLKEAGIESKLYVWTAERWEERDLQRITWEYGEGGRARLVVPDSRWKVEVSVAPRHQIKFGAWMLALPVRTNLVVSAEFPPKSEIEASLNIRKGWHGSEASVGDSRDSSVN